MQKLIEFNHFVQSPIIKLFMDKKSELKQTLVFILKNYQKDALEKDEDILD